MVGILILTHGELSLKFLETARLIGLHSEEQTLAMSVDPTATPESVRDQLAKTISKLNRGNGVLILTDLFGGTPTNLSLSFLDEGKVEVVTGLNLPMLIKSINSRNDHDLTSLAKLACDAGKENIFRAGEILRQRRPRSGPS
ncbi:MAG: PTS sugar transporter subunit IIA [Syntrophaceae bacterium]|nr:PTS sugar transporter subunit IIA [Syntrophaceae bacterium]